MTIERVLGLDIGAKSIGWALLDTDSKEYGRVVRCGVRIFDAGVDGNIEAGREESRGKRRRDMRQVRRQTDRRARRMRKLAKLLQAHGLLPEGDVASPQSRHELLKQLDNRLYSEFGQHIEEEHPGRPALAQLPYFLRAYALDNPLELHAFGRALYHLAQRRGFQSNRLVREEEEEKDGEESSKRGRRAKDERDAKTGKVKKGIADLYQLMSDSRSRTLGEYFAGTNPHQTRIRGLFTSRKMYQDEFNVLWDAQAVHHPDVLTPALRRRVFRDIFHQRPLKNPMTNPGRCEFEDGAKRAPWALPLAQRFRLLQKVNDMRVVAPDLTERPLTNDERAFLLDALEHEAAITFAQVRKRLSIPKKHLINFEKGSDDKLKGNTTHARLRGIFGERWDQLSSIEQDQVITDLRSIRDEKACYRRAKRHWKLDEASARMFSQCTLEQGYCGLSRLALKKLVPLMEQGLGYAEALREVYGEDYWKKKSEVMPLLPSVDAAGIDLRNPAVHRALTELRKVVNAVVREYGKPDRIRIELARDLRKSRDERQRYTKQSEINRKKRKDVAELITKEIAGDFTPKPGDILKIMLAIECNWHCPYTGKCVGSVSDLLSGESPFEIDHIIPRAVFPDDSYANKTLCHIDINKAKGKRLPADHFSESDLEQILDRVQMFQGDAKWAKLRRFMMKEDSDEFNEYTARQLNDTRYSARLAQQYVGLLYGGVMDAGGTRRVTATPGGATSELRKAWNMNSILGADEKNRGDHRHHAVDAIAIALATHERVQSISLAAAHAPDFGKRRWWKNVQLPWENFLEESRAAIEAIIVSHRPSRKVNGRLHKDNFYSRPQGSPGFEYAHFRKPLARMSAGELNAIVDPAVRSTVQVFLSNYEGDPKRAFADSQNLPALPNRSGLPVPVRSARIRVPEKPLRVAVTGVERYATPLGNLMEVFEIQDGKGGTGCFTRIVRAAQALARVHMGLPAADRTYDGGRFLFSLASGDTVCLEVEGESVYYVVRSVNTEKNGRQRVYCTPSIDAQTDRLLRKSPNDLLKMGLRKVIVTPLGDIRWAND